MQDSLPSEQLCFWERDSELRLMRAVCSLPKIDLHRHLTGSISAKLAIRVALRHGLRLPSYVESELQKILYGEERVSTLQEYFKPWRILNRLYTSGEAIKDLVYGVIADAADDNVVYLELRVGTHGFLGTEELTFSAFMDAAIQGAASADAVFRTTTRLVVGIPRHTFRHIGQPKRDKMCAWIAGAVASLKPRGVVGLDLNGDESAFGPESFEACFRTAKAKHVPVSIHAGEVGSAASVRYAVDGLGACRIGHGIAAAHDPELLRLLKTRQCALEICPSSNVFLGVVPSIPELPLRAFWSAGVPTLICTDNPSRCRTTLSQELFKVAVAFKLSIEDIREMTRLAAVHSFLEPDGRDRLLRDISERWKPGGIGGRLDRNWTG